MSCACWPTAVKSTVSDIYRASVIHEPVAEEVDRKPASAVFADRFMLSIWHLVVAKIKLNQLTTEDNQRFFQKVKVIDTAIKIRTVGLFGSTWRFERLLLQCGISVRQYFVKTCRSLCSKRGTKQMCVLLIRPECMRGSIW